jgi:hypothetical protein
MNFIPIEKLSKNALNFLTIVFNIYFISLFNCSIIFMVQPIPVFE